MIFTVRRFYLVYFFGNLSLDLAIWNLYFVRSAGLSLTQAAFCHALIFATIGCTDIFTGTFADRMGRSRSARIGYFLRAAGAILTILSPTFFSLVIAAIITGLGWSLLSGSTDALIYDSLKSAGRENEYSRVIANGMTLCFLARFLAFGFAGMLFEWSPSYPYQVMAAAMLFAATILLNIEERILESVKSQKTIPMIIAATKELILSSKRWLFAGLLMTSMLSNAIWMVFQPTMVASGFSPEMIGWFYAIGAIASAVGSQLTKRLDIQKQSRPAMSLFCVLGVVGSLGMALQSQSSIAAGIALLSVMFGLWYPIMSSQLNASVTSEHRATALSVVSSTDLLLGTFPAVIGALIIQSTSPGFFLFSTATGFVILFYFLLSRKNIAE